MKTMESVYGHSKYRHTLTSNSYYQQPSIPHARSGTLRPQSEYGFGGLGVPYSTRYSRSGGGGGSSGGSGGSADWPPWGAPLGQPLAPPARGARPCSALLAAAALLAALAVFAVAGLALYMGAFRTDSAEPILAFEGRFRLRRSVAAGSLAAAPPNAPRLEAALRRACAPRLGNAMVTLQMVDFNADKLTAYFRIYLDRRKVEMPIEELGDIISNILVENSIAKNSHLRQLNVDPASISIKRDNEHTFKADMLSDVTPDNKASLPMMPSNTKEKVLQTRIGVIRKTAVTPTTNPTPTVKVKPQSANSDEPEINVDELPVIQGSFQITKTEADITENKKKIEPLTREPPRTSKPATTKETTSKTTIIEAIKQTTPKTKSTTTRNTPSSTTTPRSTKIMPQKTQTEYIVEQTTENIESKKREGVDILADEKQSDLPKLDTLFAVPTYIDQEPWKPIQPGNAHSTANLNNPFVSSDSDAEERVGSAELADDITTTEEDKSFYESPIKIRIEHLGDGYSIDNYKPESSLNPYSEYSGAPVYTSFKRPHFSTTIKESQNLGERYPVPHPLPVNKLISIQDINDDDNVKPIGPMFSNSNPHPKRNTSYVSTYVPLKDRLSTVSINVKPFTEAESANTEYINLDGGVIVRKQNSSSSIKIQPNATETIPAKQPDENELINLKPLKINATQEIPSLFTNQMTWELVNETGKNHSKLRTDPNKSFNETLQAVVTKNDDKTYRPLRNDTKFQNMNNMFKNFSTIFNKLAASLRRPAEGETAVNLEEKHSATGKESIESLEEEKPLLVNDTPTIKHKENTAVPFIHQTRIDNEPTKNSPEEIPNPSSVLDNDDQPLTIHGQGSSEVVVDMTMQELLKETSTHQSTTTVIIPTLLPVKSNSGIGRPLRPRPKAPVQADESRSFTNVNPFLSEMKSFINNLQTDDNSQDISNITKTNKTSLNNTKYDLNSNKTSSVIRQTTTISPTTSVETDIVTSISFSNHTLPKNDDNVTNDSEKLNVTGTTNNFQEQNKHEKRFEPIRDHTRKIDISEKFRLPKTHPSEEINISEKIEKAFDNSNKTFVLPTATEFFLTHPSTQAIELAEKVKTIIKGLENSNIRVASTAPAFVAPIESYKDFQPKNNSVFVNYTHSALFTRSDILKNNKQNDSGNVASNDTSQVNNVGVLTDDDILSILKNISLIRTNKNSTGSEGNGSLVDTITSDKLKDLANIATITDSHNSSFFGNEKVPDETVISTKAVSSNYAVNSAGFKILTKTFNKIPGNFKDEEKKINKFYNEPAMPTVGENSQSMEPNDCAKNNLTLKCSNGQCLPETARCNRLLDCPNGEDEAKCSCADYLRSQFLLRKICDGILDCWDFSDENNCEWCTPEQYVCSNSRQCIDKDKVCDGHKDCPQGDDERQCVTVAMSQKDAQAYPYSKEGYIMVQKQGRWGRLCVQNFDKVIARSQSTLQIADLGRAVCRAMTYIDYENIDRVTEEAPETDKQYFSLHYGSRGSNGRGGLAFRKSGCSRGQVAKVVCSNLQCGARPQAASQQARIVGGGNAGAGAWPWQAALYKEGDFQCGATLISDRWLISAGHCFYHAQEDFWVARLGALRRGTTFPSPYEQLQPISSVILHPGYIDSGFINDIALLKTANRVEFSDYVRPICLPPPGSEVNDNRRCTVVGWGQLFEVGRIFPDTLQEVELPVISTGECRKRTLFLPLYRITEDMFCAGFDRGGRDACLGDSGGPLMCQEQDNQWYLYGVTSNGYGCARANRPGVYTKVANYVNWVQTTMQLYDDRSFDHPHNRQTWGNRSSSGDLEVSETRSFHRHVDKCRGHRCPLGECLPPTRVCNGFMECSDGSDEKDCL